MLFGSTMLGTAIGLVFVYLLLSMITSAINELIAHIFALRAQNLYDGIKTLLSDDNGESLELLEKIYGHRLIKNTAKKGRFVRQFDLDQRFWGTGFGKPSYISARTYARTLINLANDNNIEAKELISDITGEKAVDKFEGTIKTIEKWFDDSMDRIGGWYRRKTRWLTLFTATVVILCFNADSIAITETLWTDSTVRETVANSAEVFHEDSDSETTNTEDVDAGNSAVVGPVDPNQQKAFTIGELTDELEGLDIPLGWEREGATPDDAKGWRFRLLGWLLTFVAVSQGSPFWFDMLGRLVNLRASGEKPKKSEEATE